MLKTLARAAAAVDWGSPATRQTMAGLWHTVTGHDPDTVRRQAMEKRVEHLEALTSQLSQLRGAAAPDAATAGAAQAGGPPAADLGEIIRRLSVAGQSVDEALRFARDDGPNHPEAVRRLMRAQEIVTTLEREDLRPEVLVRLPPEQRAWAEAVMPTLRTARQALHNEQDASPATVESITRAADGIGRVQTQLRVARAMGWSAPEPSVEQLPAEEGQPYSRYAPDMDVATGCLPCGRAHLSGAVGMARNTAALARERGMADPDVQAHIQMASEEIVGLWQDDWTPEKVLASPEGERTILEATIPRIRQAHARLEAARTPDELDAAVAELVDAREAFAAMDQGGAPPAAASAAMIAQHEPTGMDRSHRVRLPAWMYSAPTTATEDEATAPADSAVAFDSLMRALGDRGVKVRIRNLPSTEQGTLEGEYLFGANSILLNAATLARDPYAVQVLAHEAAHALEDNPRCHTYDASVPYDQRTEEQMAQDASLIAMLDAGLPVELQDGTELAPGERRIDYDRLRASLAPQDYARLLWASAWISDAMRGAPRDYAAVTCPPTTAPADPKAPDPKAAYDLSSGEVGKALEALGTTGLEMAVPQAIPVVAVIDALKAGKKS